MLGGSGRFYCPYIIFDLQLFAESLLILEEKNVYKTTIVIKYVVTIKLIMLISY